MIYTVALIYIAVIVFLEVSHRRERESLRRADGTKKEKTTPQRHFSPHRKAIEKLRSNNK